MPIVGVKARKILKWGGGRSIKDVDAEEVGRIVKEACKGEPFCKEDEKRKLYGLQPYDPSKLLHYPQSHLAKIEYNDKYNKATALYRPHFQAEI
ncbi:hypothetical protein [Histophilus somni]|uniref:hypothetical protein n=1 Tax=Histophilus somni TaxID=731 RepID=UPI001E5B083C|nr:hypothetical protein [Histophilus somni]